MWTIGHSARKPLNKAADSYKQTQTTRHPRLMLVVEMVAMLLRQSKMEALEAFLLAQLLLEPRRARRRGKCPRPVERMEAMPQRTPILLWLVAQLLRLPRRARRDRRLIPLKMGALEAFL